MLGTYLQGDLPGEITHPFTLHHSCRVTCLRVFIRPAIFADIPALQALAEQFATAAHWSRREYAALFAAEAPPRIALVANEDEAICGFVIARCALDEWEIENVVVSPKHRRRGLGSELVRQILQAARQAGAGAILLEVRESNRAARQMYDRLGFVEAGRRPGYYREPTEDALLLRFSADIRDRSS